MFLNYFMVRKVMCGEGLKRAAGTVTKKLSKWLAENGYVSKEEAEDGVEEGSEAVRGLPKADRAARILSDHSDDVPFDFEDLPDEDYVDFGHFMIDRIESGKLWLTDSYGGKEELYGPIRVPASATKLLQPGWEISCGLGR